MVTSSTSTTGDTAKQEGQTFGAFMCYLVTHLRALESAREDRLFNDPFAEPLSRKAVPKLAPAIAAWMNGTDMQTHNYVNYMSIRTRYVEDAINQRNPSIRQVVLLGSGLDARAFYLESLRGCHVFEIDQAAEILAHKQQVMGELGTPLVAAKHHLVIADLSERNWEQKLLESGFDPTIPTFWNIEGLLMYIDRADDVEILKAIDVLSAPGSEFFGDMVGVVMTNEDVVGTHRMKHGEDDPLHGIFSEIGWDLKLLTSLHESGTHFGREWTRLLSTGSSTPVRFDFMVGQKRADSAP
ncbi:hypothetical protein BBJ28_00026736 [Nothophytophthora sp. Chile5]|nr:hypothetical protein BBJ28_00026736 [Nothophytophthora sp. Chile5]